MEVLRDTYPDQCVCCGRPVPEGRMVCFCCENGETHFTTDLSPQQPEKKATKKEEEKL